MFLEKKSSQKPDKNYTYGYLRYSIFGALTTSVILLVGSFFVILEVILRLINPVPVSHILAILGIIINGLATLKTSKSDSLNVKSVNFHMLEDLLGWIAVLVGSILIKITGLYIIDPILSIGITVFILLHVIKNIKEIFFILLEKAPSQYNIEKIKELLMQIENIVDVHHIHIWSMDNINNYITLHALVENNLTEEMYEKIKHIIRETLEEINTNHATIEIEFKSCSNDICNNMKNDDVKHHHH